MNRCKSVAMSDLFRQKSDVCRPLSFSFRSSSLFLQLRSLSLLVLRLSDLPDTLFRIRINTLYEKKKRNI